MAVKPGDKIYIIMHIAHHYIGEVVQITGKQEADFTNIVKVLPSGLSWDQLWEQGLTERNQYAFMPDGSMTWIGAWEWNHPIPERPNGTARRR